MEWGIHVYRNCRIFLKYIVYVSGEYVYRNYIIYTCSSDQVSEGTIVRLKGLPFQAEHDDVAKFLFGLNIVP